MDDSLFRPVMMDSRELFGLVGCVVIIPPESSDVVAVDCISPGPSDSDVEDPSLGVTDGGILGGGLPSQGSFVDVERAVIISFEDGRELLDRVVGHPGSFAKEEANLVELN